MTKEEIETYVANTLMRAKNIFGIELPLIEVKFNLRGRCAGKCKCIQVGNKLFYELQFHPKMALLNKNFEQTVIHEVAHLIAHEIHGFNVGRPHGLRWKDIMNVFGAKPETYHHFTIPGRDKIGKFGTRMRDGSYYMPFVSERNAAKERGETLYWNGEMCKVCGVKAPRYIRDNVCKECYRLR